MSLVLEALKKQEAGSNPDAAVSLARQAGQRRRHRLWMGLFAGAMAANVGVLFWVFGLPLLRDLQAPPVTPVPATEPAGPAQRPPVARAPARVEPLPQSPEPRPRVDTAGEATAAPPQRPPAPAEPPARTRVLLGSLPTAARARFPGIAFSSHVYAPDADLRAIVANGQRLTEGERIRGLEILQITESGVVLAFERYAVEVPIVGDWEPDNAEDRRAGITYTWHHGYPHCRSDLQIAILDRSNRDLEIAPTPGVSRPGAGGCGWFQRGGRCRCR